MAFSDMHHRETLRFRRRAWQWLAPPSRVAKAELLLQLACVAEADASAESDEEQIEHLEKIASMAREASAFFSGKVALWARQGSDTPSGRRYVAFDAYLSGVDTCDGDARRALADEIAYHLEPDWGVGNVLLGERFSVGPYRGATTRGFPFACLDRSGKPMDVMGAPERRFMNAGAEWSPARAAARFVDHEGLAGARAALDRFLAKHRSTTDRGEFDAGLPF